MGAVRGTVGGGKKAGCRTSRAFIGGGGGVGFGWVLGEGMFAGMEEQGYCILSLNFSES